jgi:D-3-phosphoglycerate dehydrogenase
MVEVLGGLGLEVVGVDPRLPGAPAVDEAIVDADVVTLHCALNAGTRGLFGPGRLDRLERGAVLLNTARGSLVDLDAAFAALASGRLSGLGLDVYPREPASLAGRVHPRAILLPHAAGWHPGLDDAIRGGVLTAIGALLGGEPVPFTLTEGELADAADGRPPSAAGDQARP